MSFSARSQIAIVWWAIALTVIYGLALLFLLHMVPPPSPKLSANEVADFYADRHDDIRIGAVIAGWTSAFMLPLFAVISVQMLREEKGLPIWSIITAMGGAMMSIFLVLPPLFWGVAAYTTDRSPDTTALMHQLGVLTLTTTDQFYIFAWVGVAVIALMPKTVKHSPFPRWYGYFTIWCAVMFEAGAVAFLPQGGPFSWRGLLVFWSPLSLFGLWIIVTCVLLLKALKMQRLEAEQEEEKTAAPA